LDQHFYDFTAVLIFLFAAFIPADVERKPLRPFLSYAIAVVLLTLIGFSVLPPSGIGNRLLSTVPFLLWIPFLVGWIRYVFRTRPARTLAWGISPALGIIIVGAFLNGLTPYVELKTAYSFNMYSNLLTADGASNHLLIQRTLPLRDGYEGPVQIIASSDPALELYRDIGYLIAFPEFQRYLVDKSLAVNYARHGTVFVVANTAEVEGLADEGPWWWRFMPLRALDQQSPPRCQDVFLAAL
jgi:hypothetical protein